MQVELGNLGRVVYERDLSGAEPRVLRGSIAVGLGVDESVPLPEHAVAANVRQPLLVTDAWDEVVNQLTSHIPARHTATGAAVAAQVTCLPPSPCALMS